MRNIYRFLPVVYDLGFRVYKSFPTLGSFLGKAICPPARNLGQSHQLGWLQRLIKGKMQL